MKDLTLDQLKDVLNTPIKIASFYNNIINVKQNKSIWFFPVEQEYRIFQYDKKVNESYHAETAIKYYNELTF